MVAGGCSATSADEQTASVVCNALRAADNQVIDAVNASVAGIASKEPDGRLPAILEGVDAVAQALDEWDDEIDRLELPDTDESRELRRQLHRGVSGAKAELDDQHRLFQAGEQSVVDAEVQGVVGIWFNSVEKIVSSLEPEIFRFDRRDFKQAFLDNPDCRNVIQQFVND